MSWHIQLTASNGDERFLVFDEAMQLIGMVKEELQAKGWTVTMEHGSSLPGPGRITQIGSPG
jgi:hypothetical protein